MAKKKAQTKERACRACGYHHGNALAQQAKAKEQEAADRLALKDAQAEADATAKAAAKARADAIEAHTKAEVAAVKARAVAAKKASKMR